MAKRFAIPFASSGDKIVIPNAVDAAGEVSYSEGWGPDYQLPDDDPNYKPVGRQEMNGLFNDVTDALGELQLQGVPTWVQPAGLVPPYPIAALVRYNGDIWFNTIANNSAIPSLANGWTQPMTRIAIPTGAVIPFGTTTAPTGFLVCNGAAISRTVYATLFAVIGTSFGAGDGSTTFNLPDLRGEFVRGLDQGRGVDTSRVMGSAQGHALQRHNHLMPTSAPVGAAERWYLNDSLWQFGPSNSVVETTSVTTYADNGTIGTFAGETRPRNVAMPYYIRY